MSESKVERERRQQKELRDKYLAVAKRQYLSQTEGGCGLKIPNGANVHVMQDGGAWVEATIWVSKEAIE
jgi:hypothetical protein